MKIEYGPYTLYDMADGGVSVIYYPSMDPDQNIEKRFRTSMYIWTKLDDLKNDPFVRVEDGMFYHEGETIYAIELNIEQNDSPFFHSGRNVEEETKLLKKMWLSTKIEEKLKVLVQKSIIDQD